MYKLLLVFKSNSFSLKKCDGSVETLCLQIPLKLQYYKAMNSMSYVKQAQHFRREFLEEAATLMNWAQYHFVIFLKI